MKIYLLSLTLLLAVLILSLTLLAGVAAFWPEPPALLKAWIYGGR